jgi:ribokinase
MAPGITVVGSYAAGLTMKVKNLPSIGETLLGTGYRVDYGGKGSNQAVGSARLGGRVHFIAKIGRDALGEMALRLYREEGIELTYIEQTSDAPTGVGFITVEATTGNNCIVIDPGANELLTALDVSGCAAAFRSASVVLTQLEIPVAAAEAAMRLGREARAITILNPAPARSLPPSVLQLIDILTPNQTEAKVLTGRNPHEIAEPEELARELIRSGVRQVVMTLGERGALIVTQSLVRHVPAIKVSAVDTTGAGDAFNAGLAMALGSGASLEAAVEFAVITGGLAVTREGVIPSLPRRSEVRDFYQQQAMAPPDWLTGSPADKA